MGWEWRKYGDRLYGPYFVERQGGGRRYIGRQPSMEQVSAAHQKQQAHEALREERAQLQALDLQGAELNTVIDTLVKASLVVAGYYQHHRQWRKRRNGNL